MKKNIQAGPLATAVRLLSRRDHSEQQLREKLRRNEFTAEQIDEAIVELKRRGYLDDARLKQHVLENLLGEKRHGLRSIQEKLRQLGFGQISSSELRQYYSEEAEWEAAIRLLEKRFPALYSEDFSRLARFLANRGFSTEIVSKLARECRKYQ